jgi:hypothetical protein
MDAGVVEARSSARGCASRRCTGRSTGAASSRRGSSWYGPFHAATGRSSSASASSTTRARENEHREPEHGLRAARSALELATAGELVLGGRLELLCEAIELHSDGHVSSDPTIGVCWDADRLHLPRVGIDPDPARFSTPLAQGPEPLEAAALPRTSPPTWAELIATVVRG